MKNVRILLVVLTALGVLLLFTACSGKTQASVSNTDNSTSQAVSQAPDRPAEIYGQVKAILGNEVTVSLAEPPVTVELSDAEKEKRKAEMQALSPEERQKLRNEQIKFTGETATVTIPVGTPITSGNTGGGVNLKEMALSDIYEGTFLRIWLEKGGDGAVKTAEYTRVLQSQQ